MSRAKYATPAPVAPDQDRLALAEETEGQEAMAEEIGAEPVGIEKEGQR
jgi:hypothetical protein